MVVRYLAIGALAVVANASRLDAQLTALTVAEKLFDNFTDFGVFIGGNRLVPKSNTLDVGRWTKPEKWPLSFGAELSWQIGSITKPYCVLSATPATPDKAEEDCVRQTDDDGKPKPLKVRTCAPDPGQIKEVRVDSLPGRAPATVTYVYGGIKCDPPEEKETWVLEMGLSYIQTSIVNGKDPAIDLRGVMKEVPRISLYGTRQSSPVAPYFGAFFGLSRLDDLRMLSSADSVITGTAESVTSGLATGVVLDVMEPINVFVELNYVFASFPAIKWTNERQLRPNAPTRLNLSHYNLSIGFQLTVKKKE